VKNGVDKAKYLEAFNSFGVQTKLKRAQQVATQYKLDSVPALVIDGHYTTSPAVAGHGLTSRSGACRHVCRGRQPGGEVAAGTRRQEVIKEGRVSDEIPTKRTRRGRRPGHEDLQGIFACAGDLV
jgi:hypothetical protein